jgi:hypothetical protein
MIDQNPRILFARGEPFAVGESLGRALGPRLGASVERWIAEGYLRHGRVDPDRLRRGALPWLESLPARFRDEIAGLAAGADLPLARVAEWCYVDECAAGGCSAFVRYLDGRAWVGRNNDYLASDLWGHATVREVAGLIPTLTFGLAGEPFTASGVNRERLWLHYNWLPAWDAARPEALPPYVWLSTALETCASLADVEDLLGTIDRTGGMMLFAVDGKREASAVFECGRSEHARREPLAGVLVGTNHHVALTPPPEIGAGGEGSRRRCDRLGALVAGLGGIGDSAAPVWPALRAALADPDVEARGADAGTVYAVIACPSREEVWHTFGGYPAASAGDWRQVPWPWV